MIREVKFKEEVKEQQRIGAEIVYKAVASTMGAKGKYVGIQNHYNENYLTKDGYYTSKTIILRDPVQNFGASMIKEVAQKSASGAGDGTTTSTVLTYKMYEKGQAAIDKGANAVDIKKGIEAAVKEVVKHIKEQAIPVSGNEVLRQVATVSANNNEEIGGLIADAMKQIKTEGSVVVEEANGYDSEIELVEGMRLDTGYISNYFVNKPERETCELEKTYILTYYGTISTMKSLLPVLEFLGNNKGASLLVVALEIEQEAFQTLVVNKIEGGMKIAAARVPGTGSTRQQWIEDIAAACGSTVMSENGGANLDEFDPVMLGSARKVKMDKQSTTIVEGGAIPEDLERRVATIKNQIDTAKKTDNVGLFKERLAKLIGGVAIIHVGATTEVELREKKDLFEDAIAATKSAVEEGVLPGGGTSLAKASLIIPTDHDNKDIQLGMDIVRGSLHEPLLTIMDNAGLDSAKIITSVIGDDNPNWGFNLNTETFCDMIEAGILDTAKVERMAVENSASVASMMLMMDTVIHTVNENE